MTQALSTETFQLRLLVGYLGEKDQFGWWASGFCSSTSSAFLTPIFSKTPWLARYHGMKEAARIEHDERIGRGRVFHLFRLPETFERALFEMARDTDVSETLQKNLESRESALSVLQSLADDSFPTQDGPVRVGNSDLLSGDGWLAAVAHCYHEAFASGNRSFPYLTDQT